MPDAVHSSRQRLPAACSGCQVSGPGQNGEWCGDTRAPKAGASCAAVPVPACPRHPVALAGRGLGCEDGPASAGGSDRAASAPGRPGRRRMAPFFVIFVDRGSRGLSPPLPSRTPALPGESRALEDDPDFVDVGAICVCRRRTTNAGEDAGAPRTACRVTRLRPSAAVSGSSPAACRRAVRTARWC